MIKGKKLVILLLLMILLTGNIGFYSYGEEKQDSRNYYALHTGFFMTEANATRMKSRLEDQGFYVLVIKNRGYRVLVGPYEKEREARAELSRLRRVVSNAYFYPLSKEESLELDLFQDKPHLEESVEEEPKEEAEEQSKENEIEDKGRKEGENIFRVSLAEDRVIQGIFGSLSIPVNLQEKRALDHGVLHFYYHHSALRDYPNSSITVMVNGVPIYSFFLSDGEGEHYKEVIIDGELLGEENEIQILTYHRLTNDICEIEANTALWVTLLKETFFEVTYTHEPKKDYFPYPYLPLEGDGVFDFDFILDEITPGNLEAMLTLAHELSGKRNSPKSMEEVRIITLQEIEDLDNLKRDFIYIGSPDFQGFLPEEKRQEVKEGTLGLYQHEIEGITGLFILSPEEETRSLGSKIFMRKDFILEFNHAILLKEEEIPLISIGERYEEMITFESLGYGDFTLRGSNASVEIFMQVPHGYGLGKDSEILIHSYQHPAFKDGGEITLYINEQPIGSYLIENTMKEEVYRFRVPSSFRGLSDFNLRVTLRTSSRNPCIIGNNLDLWSFISKDSSLKGAFDQKTDGFLQDFPRPFTSLKQSHFDALIFPKNPSAALVKEAMEIIYQLGRPFSSKLQPFEVLLGDYRNEGSRILFFHGEAEITEGYKEEFSIELSEDKSYIQNEGETTRFLRGNSTMGAGQLIINEGEYSLLFLGVDEGYLIYSLQEFVSRDRDTLIGDTFFMDDKTRLKSGYLLRGTPGEEKRREDEKGAPLRQEDSDLNLRVVFIAGFILLVLIGTVIIVLEFKGNRR